MNRNHFKTLSSQLGGAKRSRRANGTRSAFATASFIIAASLLAVLLVACPSTSTDTTPPTFTLSEIAGRTDVKTLTIVADEAITLLSADDAVNKDKLTVTNDVGGTDTDVPVTGATLGTDGMTVTIAIDPPVDFVAGKKVSVKIAADFAADKATTPNKNLEDTKEVTVTEDTTAPTFTLDAISPSDAATTLTLTASEPITLLGIDATARSGQLTVTNDVGGTNTDVPVADAAVDADEVTVTITVNSATTFTAGQKVSVEIKADFAEDKATTPNKNVATADPHLEVTVADTKAPTFDLSAITAGSQSTLTLTASEAITLLSTDAAANVAKLTVKNDAAGTSPVALTVKTVALESNETTVTITLDAAATFTAGQEVSVDIEADFAKDKAATPNNNAAATVKTEVATPTPTVTGVTLDKTDQTLDAGGTVTLVATVAGTNNPAQTVTWESSDTTVATVAGGVVSVLSTATGGSQTTITATSTVDTGQSASITVTVSAVTVTGVTLDKADQTLDPSGSVTLVATVAGANNPAQTVTWESSDTAVATVAGGVVSVLSTATGGSQTTITATSTVNTGQSASITVTVSAATVNSVTITGGNRDLSIATGTLQLAATVAGTNNPAQTVTWTSATPAVATVDANGLVTVASGASAGGTTDITATSTVDTGVSGSITVTLTN